MTTFPAKVDYADGNVLTAAQMNDVGAQLNALTGTAGKNKILNGDFGIWQRGTTLTNINVDFTYTADRFYVARGGTINVAKRSIGSYNPPEGFGSYAEIVNQSASNPFLSIEQTVETLNADALAGQQVTFSLYARAHANTTASKTLKLRIVYSTSSNTKGGTGLVSTTVSLAHGTAATDWQRFTLSATIPANARSITVTALQDSTLAVGDGLHITGVQLEAGSVATPFTTATGNPASELAACQRYYWRSVANAIYAYFGIGYADSTIGTRFHLKAPVTMRTAPTAVEYGGSLMLEATVGVSAAVSSITLIANVTNVDGIAISANATGLTQYRPYALQASNSATAYIGFSAEL